MLLDLNTGTGLMDTTSVGPGSSSGGYTPGIQLYSPGPGTVLSSGAIPNTAYNAITNAPPGTNQPSSGADPFTSLLNQITGAVQGFGQASSTPSASSGQVGYGAQAMPAQTILTNPVFWVAGAAIIGLVIYNTVYKKRGRRG